ncbi:hypothetical protein PIB30_096458, partial [Stylosanthes scabra]|nr:hypothetical protein [Stylosanthes scabra]
MWVRCISVLIERPAQFGVRVSDFPVRPTGKNEERKLADQETKLGSKTEQDSTHMRGRARICPNPRL